MVSKLTERGILKKVCELVVCLEKNRFDKGLIEVHGSDAFCGTFDSTYLNSAVTSEKE